MDSSSSNAAASGFIGIFFVVYFLFIAAVIAFSIWLQWRILVKAGYSGWLSLLVLTGIGGLVIQLIMAFGRWPIEDQLLAAQTGQPIQPNPFAVAPPAPPSGPPATL